MSFIVIAALATTRQVRDGVDNYTVVKQWNAVPGPPGHEVTHNMSTQVHSPVRMLGC
jgi:hypothetical protein